MLRKNLAVAVFGVLMVTGLNCAPQDPTPPKSMSTTVPVKPAAHVEVHTSLRDRIDAALQHVEDREVRTTFNFWAVFHQILGLGPNQAMLVNPATGERIKAIDYIRNAGKMQGLQFEPTGYGVNVVSQPGTGIGQGHQDQFVAEMAQWGLPRDLPFMVEGKEYAFEDFVRNSKMQASTTRKQELSWAIVIAAEYFGTDHEWTNRYGEKLAVTDLARYELNEPIDTAACGGTHRLFGLTWAYFLHRKNGGKKEGVWADVARHLDQYAKQARDFQNADGTFSTKYVSDKGSSNDVGANIGSSGHVFEWLALVLPDEELRAEWMQRGANKLATLILENQSMGIDGGALYHAAHGLGIYRARVFGAEPGHAPNLPPVPAD